jgi:hypothetical protein
VAGDAIRVREALTGASSTWEIRLRMAAMGWLSQTRIMDERRGGACFQIWFKRQDWHGRLSPDHTTVDSGYRTARLLALIPGVSIPAAFRRNGCMTWIPCWTAALLRRTASCCAPAGWQPLARCIVTNPFP